MSEAGAVRSHFTNSKNKIMYDSTLVEQFISDIRVIDLGQTVIIDCCPLATFNNYETYEFRCLRCEEIKLYFEEIHRDCIEDGCIDLLEFSVRELDNNKTSVYIYGRVVTLSVLCEEVEIIK